ncbi:MAG: bacteriocin, partial [Bosea sp. (in: a-proteobacteria)]|nr:bacteriocin [Bosea sp. (in: a-proteobacteria)]
GLATGRAGGALAGAAIGGAGGAIIGSATSPTRTCVGRDEYGRRFRYDC